MRPKLVAAVLVGGTLAPGAGSAVLAELPSPNRSPATVAAASTNATRTVPTSTSSPKLPISPYGSSSERTQSIIPISPSTTAPAVSRTPTPSVVIVTTITYAAKSGDTPSSIAKWFAARGYGATYKAHENAVGGGTNRLVTGELISISDGKLTVQRPT